MAKSTSPQENKTGKNATSPIAPNTVITLTVPWAQAEPIYTRVLRKTAARVKLPGFRAGKVPSHLAEDSIGSDKLIEATLEEVLPAIYQEALTKAKKQPLTAPQIKPIKVNKGQDWTVEAHFAEAPEVKLGDYKKIVKTAQKTAQTSIADREKELKKAAETAAKDTKTPKASAQPTSLSEQEKKDITSQSIFSALIKAVGPAIPELLIHREVRHDLEHLARTLDQVKISFDDYLKRRQMSFDQLSGELAATALARLQLDFILSAIATQEKIAPTDEEVHAQLHRIEDEKVKHDHSHDPEYVQYITGILTRQKTIAFLQTI